MARAAISLVRAFAFPFEDDAPHHVADDVRFFVVALLRMTCWDVTRAPS